jgi:HSP20 family protein
MRSILKAKENGGEKSQSLPALDIYENDKEFLLMFDMPGVADAQANVRLDGERLSVQGTTADRVYQRELAVPASVDAENVGATVKAGVLTVKLPKKAPFHPRQITVRAA